MGHGLSSVSSINNFHHGIPLPSHVMVMCAHLGFHGKWKENQVTQHPLDMVMYFLGLSKSTTMTGGSGVHNPHHTSGAVVFSL